MPRLQRLVPNCYPLRSYRKAATEPLRTAHYQLSALHFQLFMAPHVVCVHRIPELQDANG